MPFPTTSAAELRHHLDRLGIEPGDRLAVHSRLLSFGRVEGGPALVCQVLRERIGESGTLIVPAYTFDPVPPFDPAHRPGEGVGALSDHVRLLPGAIRSLCPIHSHAGIGPEAVLLRQSDPECSLGPGSDFDLMRRHGFKVLLLGCGFSEGCAYIHHVEAVAGVPYRHWLTLARQRVEPDGGLRPVICRYYARSRTDLTPDFEPVRRRLDAAGLVASAPCPLGESHACRIEDLHAVTLALLRDDPMALMGGG
ncbi:hypothetical protein A6A04_01850 [Paramagnetospirillum marisnigri]|uniref:Aminoglycoside N(3)-acetyltransferase n=1 Tax=Paramagnetospirillum marisnigri TaxID=1285242 RepID=A0A178MPZ6_9PROT|nr:AAC(3) family N-acetyltransferase [Paramagnetospirillum marisnigri]OAN50178.1 hypothetical protein A6A04_01850 [Paramagnetospirillum marisnigri]